MDETEETSRQLRKLGKEADRLTRETEKELKRYQVPDERQRREQRNRDRRLRYRRKVLEKKEDRLIKEWEQLSEEHKQLLLYHGLAQSSEAPANVKELETEWDALQVELGDLRDEENRPWRESQEKEARRALRAVIIASVISGAIAGAIVAAVLILVGVDRLIVVVASVGAALFFALASWGSAMQPRRW